MMSTGGKLVPNTTKRWRQNAAIHAARYNHGFNAMNARPLIYINASRGNEIYNYNSFSRCIAIHFSPSCAQILGTCSLHSSRRGIRQRRPSNDQLQCKQVNRKQRIVVAVSLYWFSLAYLASSEPSAADVLSLFCARPAADG